MQPGDIVTIVAHIPRYYNCTLRDLHGMTARITAYDPTKSKYALAEIDLGSGVMNISVQENQIKQIGGTHQMKKTKSAPMSKVTTWSVGDDSIMVHVSHGRDAFRNVMRLVRAAHCHLRELMTLRDSTGRLVGVQKVVSRRDFYANA